MQRLPARQSKPSQTREGLASLAGNFALQRQTLISTALQIYCFRQAQSLAPLLFVRVKSAFSNGHSLLRQFTTAASLQGCSLPSFSPQLLIQLQRRSVAELTIRS